MYFARYHLFCVVLIGVIIFAFLDKEAFSSEVGTYTNLPKIIKILDGLESNSSINLSAPKVKGLPLKYKNNSYLKNGPFTRSYCNKMPYAIDRQTAFYCGQDHNLPHFNDAWEYHLGSNTWHCLTPPDGGDTGVPMRKWLNQFKKETDPDKLKNISDRIGSWMKKHVVLQNGYLQTRINGGPIMAWHTWDGVTYDPITKRLFWAVLDDNIKQRGYLKRVCQFTGKDFNNEQIRLKPGMGLWWFDPDSSRWTRRMGGPPHPRMKGMGGFLHYIPDLKKIIWYAASPNVSPHEFGMWIYDTISDTWTELKPNNGKSISTLVQKLRIAPYAEMQVAYSEKHKKLVAVQGHGTFIYDIRENAWSLAAYDKNVYAHDSKTIFDYDSVNDVFLLLQPNKKTGYYRYTSKGKKWNKLSNSLYAFSLEKTEWKIIIPKGAGLPVKESIMKGFFDPTHNVFVAIGGQRPWVYRFK